MRGSSESDAAALREGESECQLNFSFFSPHPPPPPTLTPVLQRGQEETEAEKKKIIKFHSREKWLECRRHVSHRGTPARGPYFCFPYMYLFWFRERVRVKNNSTAAARIIIKFHTASVPLGRGPLILLKGFFFFFFLSNKPDPVTSGVFFLCVPLLPRTIYVQPSSPLSFTFPRFVVHINRLCIYNYSTSFHLWPVQLPFRGCFVMTVMWMRAVQPRQPRMLWWWGLR